MKKLLFVLLALPLAAGAQLVEVGINGGIIPYADYKAVNQPLPTWNLEKESASSYSMGGRLGLNLRRMQIGVAAEYQDITHKSAATGGTSPGSFHLTGIENKIASSFLATYIYLNRGWQLPRGYIYIGVSGGYAMADMSSYNIGLNTAAQYIVVGTPAKSKGFLGGGQLGYVLGLSRHFGISFEVACRYASLKSNYAKQGGPETDYQYENTLVFLPTLIGFRYQIGRDCSGY